MRLRSLGRGLLYGLAASEHARLMSPMLLLETTKAWIRVAILLEAGLWQLAPLKTMSPSARLSDEQLARRPFGARCAWDWPLARPRCGRRLDRVGHVFADAVTTVCGAGLAKRAK